MSGTEYPHYTYAQTGDQPTNEPVKVNKRSNGWGKVAGLGSVIVVTHLIAYAFGLNNGAEEGRTEALADLDKQEAVLGSDVEDDSESETQNNADDSEVDVAEQPQETAPKSTTTTTLQDVVIEYPDTVENATIDCRRKAVGNPTVSKDDCDTQVLANCAEQPEVGPDTNISDFQEQELERIWEEVCAEAEMRLDAVNRLIRNGKVPGTLKPFEGVLNDPVEVRAAGCMEAQDLGYMPLSTCRERIEAECFAALTKPNPVPNHVENCQGYETRIPDTTLGIASGDIDGSELLAGNLSTGGLAN